MASRINPSETDVSCDSDRRQCEEQSECGNSQNQNQHKKQTILSRKKRVTKSLFEVMRTQEQLPSITERAIQKDKMKQKSSGLSFTDNMSNRIGSFHFYSMAYQR